MLMQRLASLLTYPVMLEAWWLQSNAPAWIAFGMFSVLTLGVWLCLPLHMMLQLARDSVLLIPDRLR